MARLRRLELYVRSLAEYTEQSSRRRYPSEMGLRTVKRYCYNIVQYHGGAGASR